MDDKINENINLEEKLNSNPKYREAYDFNMKLIDLSNIPSKLCKLFYDSKKWFFES